MTLFHFINCIALTYSPLVIAYRCTGLLDIGALWKCMRSGVAYFITQLVKMMLLATFFPISDDNNNYLMESVKCSVDVLDFLGIYLVLTKFLNKTDRKVLVTALGWSTCKLVSTKILPLWFGARGIEFDWKYIQSSFDSNIDLVLLFSTCTFLWIFSRNDVNKSLLLLVVSLLIVLCYKPLFVNIISTLVNSWILLAIKAILAAGIGIIALTLYPTKQ